MTWHSKDKMKPNDKMTDSEVLETMNQLYREYMMYWNEYARRIRRDGERVSKAQSPGTCVSGYIGADRRES